MKTKLFSNENAQKRLPVKDAEIYYFPNFIALRDEIYIFNFLVEKLPWKSEEIKLFGKLIKQPRLTAFFSANGILYTYSGITRFRKISGRINRPKTKGGKKGKSQI